MPPQSTVRPPIASSISFRPDTVEPSNAANVASGSPLVRTYGKPSITATNVTAEYPVFSAVSVVPMA
jgi:hypothetical protein